VILRPISPIPPTATVHCLINEDTGTWNEENVFAFFSAATAAQILQVPISRHAGEDFVCWPHTRHGIFSVRLAYNLARSTKFFQNQSRTGRGMVSDWAAQEKEWKAIWKIKAPGKMIIHVGASLTIVYLVVCNSAGGRYRRTALVFFVAELRELSMHSFFVSLRERYGGRLNSESH
jgi:hypothetical protein